MPFSLKAKEDNKLNRWNRNLQGTRHHAADIMQFGAVTNEGHPVMTPADCLERFQARVSRGAARQGPTREGQPGRAPRGRGSQAGPVGIADLRRQLKDQGGRSSKDTEKRELHRGKSGYMNTPRHSAEN